jgi:hypothetical protein
MSQPVKLSDALVLDARLTGEVFQRSIAGQIEFWARLGRSVEELLNGRQVLEISRNQSSRSLYEALETVDSPQGRERLEKYLETLPFPHYAPCPGRPGTFIRTEVNGQRSIGRFVRREFVAESSNAETRGAGTVEVATASR